jgi:hypothetical protein
MPRRPDAHGLPLSARIRPGPATYPVRTPRGTIRVTVPVDWPQSIRHEGMTFIATGKIGHRASDRMQAAEYEVVDDEGRRTGRRVWLLADGTITEE